MSSFKHTYILKQETPLIHFQHDQAGATLRASEVKPKLDRFLCGKYGLIRTVNGSETPKAEYKSWFIGDTTALDYKLTVSAVGSRRITDDTARLIGNERIKERNRGRPRGEQERPNNRSEINEMYFANMPDLSKARGMAEKETVIREACKEYVYSEQPVEIKVMCFHGNLSDILGCGKIIYEFFLVNNFGNRQTKGFGGFTLRKIDGNDVQFDPPSVLTAPNNASLTGERSYAFFYAIVRGNTSYQTMLNHACTVYASMKGGINRSTDRENRYIKGYIQRYYLDDTDRRNVGSDKAFTKEYIIQAADDDHVAYEDYQYVRALLGLADHYEYRNDLRNGIVKVESSDGTVSRFRSPVTIKIVGNYLIFFFAKKLEEPRKLEIDGILGKSFTFTGESERNGTDKRSLPTPSEFVADTFVDLFTQYFNGEVAGDGGILDEEFQRLPTYYNSRNLRLVTGRDSSR